MGKHFKTEELFYDLYCCFLMNKDIINYCLKICFTSYILIYPVAHVRIIVRDYFYPPFCSFGTSSEIYGWDLLIIFGKFACFSLTCWVVFSILNIFINNMFANTTLMKQVNCSVCIFLILGLYTEVGYEMLYSIYGIYNTVPHIILFTWIFFIWVFKLKNENANLNVDHILDAEIN